MVPGVITVDIQPEYELGPLTIAWHGATIALGILLGSVIAGRWAKRRGLATEELQTLAIVLTVAGMVGGRLFYVGEHGGPLLGTRGFTFDGGFILAAVALLVWVRRNGLDLRYLDAIAFALPAGVALGRVGDVINGEHYGDVSTSFLAVRNANPGAQTPNSALAYQNGGLYEVLLALLIFAAVILVHRRIREPGDLAWFVFAAFGVGRFFVFFLRSDSPELALGLSNAQWTSIVLVIAAIIGWTWTARRRERGTAGPPATSRA